VVEVVLDAEEALKAPYPMATTRATATIPTATYFVAIPDLVLEPVFMS